MKIQKKDMGISSWGGSGWLGEDARGVHLSWSTKSWKSITFTKNESTPERKHFIYENLKQYKTQKFHLGATNMDIMLRNSSLSIS